MICIEWYCEIFYVLDCVALLCVLWLVWHSETMDLYSWTFFIEVMPWIKKARRNITNELKIVILNNKLMVYWIGVSRSTRYSWIVVSCFDTLFLDQSVTFRHDIIGSECHVLTLYFWIEVSHSDTVFLDRGVTFWHGIVGSECNIPTR